MEEENIVKLKLTPWAEEQIKERMDTFTALSFILDKEVMAAHSTGFIEIPDSIALFLKDGSAIIVKTKNGDVRYDRKTWQVYNPPKRKKQ